MNRRHFLGCAAGTVGALALPTWSRGATDRPETRAHGVTLFLCGDVMTGRGIDQILPHPVDPELFEPWVRDARRYVELAETRHGAIPAPVELSYPWGRALSELDRRRPEVRIVNLETSITAGGEPWQGKGIHYRMSPANLGCLTAAGIDVYVLANNHVLDWGYRGLSETLSSLRRAEVAAVGAGSDLAEASAPAILELSEGRRVVVFAFGATSSGIPADWAATEERPGVWLLPDLSTGTVDRIAAETTPFQGPKDVVVASIHWGANWGYEIPAAHRRLARDLVEGAGVDVVFGHSSHHPLGIEVHHGRPILFGCGDFINDYEGIGGYESFRGDLVLAYWLSLDFDTGRLLRLEMTPLRSRRLRLEFVSPEDARWLTATLDRECRALGSRITLRPDGDLELSW